MSVPLAQAGEVTVRSGVVSASGWIVGLGGILLTALWLRRLVR